MSRCLTFDLSTKYAGGTKPGSTYVTKSPQVFEHERPQSETLLETAHAQKGDSRRKLK